MQLSEQISPSKQISLTDLSREEKLQIWMRRTGVTYRQIADYLGITSPSTIKLLRGDTMPVRRHVQCLAFGMPPELMPEPFDITPGRPRGGGGKLGAVA